MLEAPSGLLPPTRMRAEKEPTHRWQLRRMLPVPHPRAAADVFAGTVGVGAAGAAAGIAVLQ